MPRSLVETLDALDAQIKLHADLIAELRAFIGIDEPPVAERPKADPVVAVQHLPDPEPDDEPSVADQQEGEYDARYEAGRQAERHQVSIPTRR